VPGFALQAADETFFDTAPTVFVGTFDIASLLLKSGPNWWQMERCRTMDFANFAI